MFHDPQKRGYSLIELIVVLSLLVVLSSTWLLLQSAGTRRDDAQERRQAFHHDLLLMKTRLKRDLRSTERIRSVGDSTWILHIWRDGADGLPKRGEIRWQRIPHLAVVERRMDEEVQRWDFRRHERGEEFVFAIHP